nr:hypothetical protein [Tanacetum cinerariifolium]
LLTKKGVEVVAKKIEIVRVPKKKHTETIIEETSQSKERVSQEGTLDHSKKLKGIKTLSSAAQYLVDMKTPTKISKDDFILQQCSKGIGEGCCVIPEVPDWPSDRSDSLSLESNNKEGFLSTDDEASQEKSEDERIKVDDSKGAKDVKY